MDDVITAGENRSDFRSILKVKLPGYSGTLGVWVRGELRKILGLEPNSLTGRTVVLCTEGMLSDP